MVIKEHSWTTLQLRAQTNKLYKALVTQESLPVFGLFFFIGFADNNKIKMLTTTFCIQGFGLLH